MKSMSTRFGENDFKPIMVDGVQVHPMLKLSVDEGDVVRISWISAINSPCSQGLSLRLRDPSIGGQKGYAGRLRLDDIVAPAFGVWSDQGPNALQFDVLEVRPGAELWISNTWRTPEGREDEWFEDYGIVIEIEGPRQFLLRCNAGLSRPMDFDDLVVRVEVEPRG